MKSYRVVWRFDCEAFDERGALLKALSQLKFSDHLELNVLDRRELDDWLNGGGTAEPPGMTGILTANGFEITGGS